MWSARLAWRIEFATGAEKQLAKLGPGPARRIAAFLRERVADDPRASGRALRGPLGDLWRYRVGDFRVICELQDAVMRVLVVRLGDRKDVYR